MAMLQYLNAFNIWEQKLVFRNSKRNKSLYTNYKGKEQVTIYQFVTHDKLSIVLKQEKPTRMHSMSDILYH